MIIPYKEHVPEVARAAFIAPNATVIGDVELGEGSSVWFGAVLRGDVQPIRIGARSNVQDNSVFHASVGLVPTIVGEDCTVGHAAIVHGATLHDRVTVGMGAILLDEAEIGSDVIVGAGALVTARTKIPPEVLVVGSPARVKRQLSQAELDSLRWSARHYVEKAGVFAESLGARGAERG